MYILVTGGEKVGKTTLCLALAETSRALDVDAVHIRSRYHKDLHPTVYMAGLIFGIRSDVLVIADRAWPDEVVYSRLTGRACQLPTLYDADARYNRLLRQIGFGVVLAPPARRADRTDDDHQIPYSTERAAFIDYGRSWKYDIINYEWQVDELAARLLAKIAVCRSNARPNLECTTSLKGHPNHGSII